MNKKEWNKLLHENALVNEAKDGYETVMLRDAKNQKGTELLRGEKVVVMFTGSRADFVYIVSADDPKRLNRLMVRTVNLHKYVKGATKEPSEKLLYKMSDAGIAKSVLGKRVEPDGYDQYGSPSWLLVIGLI